MNACEIHTYEMVQRWKNQISPRSARNLVFNAVESELKNGEAYLEATMWLELPAGKLNWFDTTLLNEAAPLPLSCGRYASPPLN